jgi:hypothetical protein
MITEELIEILKEISNEMKLHHLHNKEHNLYISSLNGYNPSKLMMAYMFKNGIGTWKNCTTASYYLSSIRSTKVERY